MCKIPRRGKPDPDDDKLRVFFYQRGYGRQLENADSLCTSLRGRPDFTFESYPEQRVDGDRYDIWRRMMWTVSASWSQRCIQRILS